MAKLLGFLGMTVGSWVGWIVGGWFSLFTAFILSFVGAGVGLYAGREVMDRYF